MKGKSMKIRALVVVGVYFLLFHSEPFPLSHNAIGLPPYHVIHAIFGALLLAGAAKLRKTK